MLPNMVARIEDVYFPLMSSGTTGEDKAPPRQLPLTSACSSFQQTTVTMAPVPVLAPATECTRNFANNNNCQREYSYSNRGCDQQQRQQPYFKQQFTRMVPQNEIVRWTQSNDLNHRFYAQQQQQQQLQQQSVGGNDMGYMFHTFSG